VIKGRIDRGGMRERENIDSYNLAIKVTWKRKKRKEKTKEFVLIVCWNWWRTIAGMLGDVSVVSQ